MLREQLANSAHGRHHDLAVARAVLDHGHLFPAPRIHTAELIQVLVLATEADGVRWVLNGKPLLVMVVHAPFMCSIFIDHALLVALCYAIQLVTDLLRFLFFTLLHLQLHQFLQHLLPV